MTIPSIFLAAPASAGFLAGSPSSAAVGPGLPATPSGLLGPLEWIGKHPVVPVIALIAVAIALVLWSMFRNGKLLPKKSGGTMNAEKRAGAITIGNAHHIGARENQQDSFAISDISNHALSQKKGVFAVVADGMGGLSNGAMVSTAVTRAMLKYFNERPLQADPATELLAMLGYANDAVNAALGRGGQGKSGSTVVAALLRGKELYWISVGDSRICLVRGGAIFQLNREHTYGADLDEQAAMGEISFETAKSDPQRAAVTSYLGMGRIEKIDRNVRPVQLLAGDRLLLMSDGVFGTLTDAEILSAMPGSAFESGQRLEQMVLLKNKPKQDNLTAIVIDCG